MSTVNFQIILIFGFRPRRSTELAYDLLVNYIRKNIDNGLLTGVIYLDVSKAFDRVSHLYLSSKLPSYGMNWNEFTWFENDLFNWKQHVFYTGHLSKAFPIFRGIPNWSISGPTLFLLNLDDDDNCLRHSSIIKYADDKVIYVIGNYSESMHKKLNADMLEVHNWLTDTDLSLNLEHVYMRPEVNSNRFEISNSFEVSFRLHYCLHGKLTTVWDFTLVNLTEVRFALKCVSLQPKSCEHWCFLTAKWNLKPVWVHFGSHVNMLLKEGKTESMIFGNSIHVKKTPPLNIQIKETSINQTSFQNCLEAHLDSALALNRNFNLK